ncbi:hypothetical protein GCM10027275_30120 [Rhabdobacter roseus]|uniref:Class I SAM-dependent methyltransferase n=1 Tax=Rhabdobacter roseus TaxID=1655419 RepID=A0A840TZB2_9BACT|nr:class I SAM-dependent methyltransferase [Rhabdobacter roseus]MBB5284969.1 hypothetical protein [Rhabdobacter roseus]
MEYSQAKKAYQNINKIAGWFSEEAAMALALFDEVQKQNQYSGDIFEIGVHHGKSALFLHQFLSDTEDLRICDLFNYQTQNISTSGKGDKVIFLNHLHRVLKRSDITLFEKSSNHLSVKEIGRSYRMFHIDGGHSCQEALSDLELAAEAVHPYGVIILDDPFRSEWPGVTEALIAFLKKSSNFSALLIGFNKLFIVHNNYYNLYASAFDNVAHRSNYALGFPLAYKTVSFLEKDLRCFYIPTYIHKPSLKQRIYIQLKKWGLK